MNEFSELWLTITWRRDRKTESEILGFVLVCVCDSVVWDWGELEFGFLYIFFYLYIVFLFM